MHQTPRLYSTHECMTKKPKIIDNDENTLKNLFYMNKMFVTYTLITV